MPSARPLVLGTIQTSSSFDVLELRDLHLRDTETPVDLGVSRDWRLEMAKTTSLALLAIAAVTVVGCAAPPDAASEPAAKDEAAFIAGDTASACASGYVLVDGSCIDEGTYAFLYGSDEPMAMPASSPEPVIGGGGTFFVMPPEEPEDQVDIDQLHRDVQGCFDSVDYNRLGYSYAPAGEAYTNHSGSTAWSVATYIGSVAGWLVQTSEQTRSWVEYLTFGGTSANQYLDGVVDQMTTKFASGGFQNYQKVCLAQCIASRIIKHEENMLSKFGGVSNAVAQGMGVCTEFSAIAQRLISRTSSETVSSWVGYSPGHAFVQVQFDGNTYSIEPQNDPAGAGTCRFYN